MSSVQTVVCVKEVKQNEREEWDESMPLPGDIIEGIAEDGTNETFVPAKARSELTLHLGKINRVAEYVWLKVRRGEGTVKLRVCVVPDRNVKLQKRFTVRAASDERHVAVLADLTFEECFELQEMSRRVVNLDCFHKKGIRYDWKRKVGSYLPDNRSTVVSSVLFMPLNRECGNEAPTVRAMAWFSAAVSSGIPLVFINIQTEQIISSTSLGTGKELAWSRQQSMTTTAVNIVQGIRLWFLPGVAEVLVQLFPESGETRFGMDIKRNEEGFMFIQSVTRGTSAERAGLGNLLEQASKTGHRLVISRLQGKSLIPSTVDSEGLIHCCDDADVKQTLFAAMDNTDNIKLHVMSWPNEMTALPPESGAATLRPPNLK